jgi:hypothetical protein
MHRAADSRAQHARVGQKRSSGIDKKRKKSAPKPHRGPGHQASTHERSRRRRWLHASTDPSTVAMALPGNPPHFRTASGRGAVVIQLTVPNHVPAIAARRRARHRSRRRSGARSTARACGIAFARKTVRGKPTRRRVRPARDCSHQRRSRSASATRPPGRTRPKRRSSPRASQSRAAAKPRAQPTRPSRIILLPKPVAPQP